MSAALSFVVRPGGGIERLGPSHDGTGRFDEILRRLAGSGLSIWRSSTVWSSGVWRSCKKDIAAVCPFPWLESPNWSAVAESAV